VIQSFSTVSIDQMTLHFNQEFGLKTDDFYGQLYISNSNIHNNDGHGLLLLNQVKEQN
jgi:hypothetical protein